MGFGPTFMLFETVFPILFIVVFLLVLGAFVYTIGYSVFRGIKNQKSPELVRTAKVVSKRTEVGSYGSHRHHHQTHHMHTGVRTYTRYFVTFELEDRSREEFQVTDRDFGLLVEGDEGRLFSRGTRFQGFERYR